MWRSQRCGSGACGETAGQCRSDVFCHAVLFGAESGRLFQNATPSHIPVTLPSGTQGPEEVRGALGSGRGQGGRSRGNDKNDRNDKGDAFDALAVEFPRSGARSHAGVQMSISGRAVLRSAGEFVPTQRRSRLRPRRPASAGAGWGGPGACAHGC